MAEILHLRLEPAWEEFMGRVQAAIVGPNPRLCLQQHMTTSNQPGRAPGVCGSAEDLITCGADDIVYEDGKFYCTMTLPALLETDDGVEVGYRSKGMKNFKSAQKDAFLEVLSYILFRGADFLRAHVSQWRVEQLNDARVWSATGLRDSLGPRPSGSWSPIRQRMGGPVAIRQRQPRPRARQRVAGY